MASSKKIYILSFLSIILLIFFNQRSNFAQSNRDRAKDWVEKGHLAHNLNDKVEAYLKAAQLDSSYMDAYYFLAKAYQAQRQHDKARSAFLQALRLAEQQNDVQLAYKCAVQLAEMGLYTNNKRDYENALKTAIQYAPTDSHRQELKVQLSRFLYKNNRKTEALAILKELQTQIGRTSSKTFLSHTQLVAMLEQLKKYINDGKLNLAKTLLDSINASGASFGFSVRIAKLDSTLKARMLESENKKMYSLAIELATQGKVEEAIFLLEKILANSPNYRDAVLLLKQYKKIRDQQKKRQKVDSHSGQPKEKARIATTVEINGTKEKHSNNEKKVSPKLTKISSDSSLNKIAHDSSLQTTVKKKNISLADNRKTQDSSQLQADSQLNMKTDENIKKQKEQVENIQIDSRLDNIKKKDDRQKILGHIEQDSAFSQIRSSDRTTFNNNQTAHDLKTGKIFKSPWVWAILAIMGSLLISLYFIHLIYPLKVAQVLIFLEKIDLAISYMEWYLQKKPDRLEFYPLLANLYIEVGKDDEKAIQVYKTILDRSIKVNHLEEVIRQVRLYYERNGAMDSYLQTLLERQSEK